MNKKLKSVLLLLTALTFLVSGCSSSSSDTNSPTDQQIAPHSREELGNALTTLPQEWTEINWQDDYPYFSYMGLQPGCSACPKDDGTTTDPEFSFFVKGGATNNLVVFFEGGGACWNTDSCINNPTSSHEITITADKLSEFDVLPPNGTIDENAVGMFFNDYWNNPFKGWGFVFIPYCTGDIHVGANDNDYATVFDQEPKVIRHRGAVNFQVVLQWMKDNIDSPEKVFITGSSAGGYGALFQFPYIRELYPDSDAYTLADASCGITTVGFRSSISENWNFQLPDDIITDLEGTDLSEITIADGLIAAMKYYPEDRFAQYTTEADVVQVGFYGLGFVDSLFPPDIFLVDALLLVLLMQPITADWYDLMVSSSEEIANEVENFKYYTGTGSDHTIMMTPKFYTEDTASGKPYLQWVKDMLDPDFDWNGSANWTPAD